jgi:hypothetical protein
MRVEIELEEGCALSGVDNLEWYRFRDDGRGEIDCVNGGSQRFYGAP